MTALQSLQPPLPSSAPAPSGATGAALDTITAHSTQRARLAESARYALLRRLAPAIRHDMAGALQPISMVAAMLEKRLQKPDPDLLALAKNVNAINALARDASQACMQLMTWLSPKVDEATPIATGVAEAIALVATDLSFKGFTLVNQTDAVDISVAVRVSVLRGLFMATLLATTDRHHGPARVLLDAHTEGQMLVLGVTLEALEGEQGEVLAGMPAAYRSLDWDDVLALAAAESAELVQTPYRVELRCSLETAV